MRTHPSIHNILFLQHKGIHPEICQWQAPLNCWPGLAFWTIPADILSPSQDASLQASDSSARYPVVPLLCWPSHGRMGNKNREAEMPPVWLFKAASPVCYAQRATSAAGSEWKECFGELMRLHALHADNKKILILFLGPIQSLFWKTGNNSEVCLNKRTQNRSHADTQTE